MTEFCNDCKRIVSSANHQCQVRTIRDVLSGVRDGAASAGDRSWASKAQAICLACPNWGTRRGSTGCLLSPTKPCDIGYYRRKGRGCFDDPPRFAAKLAEPEHVEQIALPPHKPFTGRVGFLSSDYNHCGGTEVWHQTLLPRLGGLVHGFAVTRKLNTPGDFSMLGGCDCVTGVEAAREMVRECDTVVAWGVGSVLSDILDSSQQRPRVIGVSHCDGQNGWTRQYLAEQGPHSDVMVHICPTGIETIPEHLRKDAVLIPNAPDPSRLATTGTPSQIRAKFGISEHCTVLVTASRLSGEKRLDLLEAATKLLPGNYVLVVAGGVNADVKKQDFIRSSARVKLIGVQKTPGDLLSIADAYLSAASLEGYGLSMAEAMLAGVPVVATPVGLMEYDSGLARTVPLDSTPETWASVIQADFARPGEQADRARFAKHYMSTEHSVDKFVNSWRSLLCGKTNG